MSQLRALLVFLGLAAIGGGYYVTRPAPGATLTELNAAGLSGCPVRRAECRVRRRAGCGAGPNYALIQTAAKICDIPGQIGLVVLGLPPCWDLVGTPTEACRAVEAGCTDGALCITFAAVMPVREETPLCACRLAAGTCTWSPPGMASGPAPFGRTLEAGTWAGAGCSPKYCGPELSGEQGDSWPAGCPQ